MAVEKKHPAPRGTRQASRPRTLLPKGVAKNRVKKVKGDKKLVIPWHNIKKVSIVFLVGVVSFICVVGVGFSLMYGYRYFTRTEYFSLRDIEIHGNFRLTSREILEIADLEDGANLVDISLDRIRYALTQNAWVQKVTVKRQLPSKLLIGIEEKEPIFLVLLQNTMHYADERGRIIAPVALDKFTLLPTLEIEDGAEAIAASLPQLVDSLHQSQSVMNMDDIAFVRLSAAKEVELYFREGQLHISIAWEEWLGNITKLDLVLQDLQRRGELSSVRKIRAQGNNVWVAKG